MSSRAEELRKRQLIARQQALRSSFPPEPAGGVSTNPGAVDDFEAKLGAGIAGAVNGASFGLADEAQGLIDGLIAAPGDGTFVEGYTSGRDRVRAEHAKRQEAEPGLYLSGEIGGAVLPALASAPLATGKNILGTMMRGAGIGGVEGGLHGIGSGEGADDSAKKGLDNAMLGALLGGAIPGAISGGKSLYRGLADPIGGALNVGNAGRARRALATTVKKSGQSLDDITDDIARASRQGQPEFRTMDALGVAGQRRASGITRAGGAPGDDIAEYLGQRQLDQGDRVAGFVEDAFDLRGTSAARTESALKAGRDATADTAYSAARGNAAPVDVRAALGVIDNRLGGMQGVDIAGDSIDGRLARFKDRLTAKTTPGGVDSIELSDFDRVLLVKQDVQDAVGAAVRAGRGNEARELGKLVSALDEALEGSSDMYRAANDGFRESSRVMESVGRGADMAKPGQRSIDTVDVFNKMTPDQQAAARVGYGDKALAKIEATAAPTSNRAAPFQRTKALNEADAIASDPALFRDRMARESQMWETQNRALGGSRTADNLADMGRAGQVAADGAAVGGSLATGNVPGAISGVSRLAAPWLTGQNEAMRKLMVKALMSKNPQAALGPAVQGAGMAQVRQRMLEALLRNAGRENGELN